MKAVAVPSIGGRWAVAYIAPGLPCATGIMDCRTRAIAEREAAKLRNPTPAQQADHQADRPVRRFDADQALLFE